VASLKNNFTGIELSCEFEAPPGCVPVALYHRAQLAHEAGLAILAMGQAYWLVPHGEGVVLCVAENRAEIVRTELAAVDHLERAGVKSKGDLLLSEREVGAGSFLIYAALLVSFYLGQARFPIVEMGRVDATLMVEGGQWWRAVTALTLHGDVVHLVSNLVAGIGFALLLARYFGAGMAWLLILLAGVMGNALNAWIYYPDSHLAIGASTAVFGALGLVTGVALWIALKKPQERWSMPHWLMPAFGGLTLLGLLGVGDGLNGRIDVAAHICGFACGSALGFLCGMRHRFLASRKLDWWARVATVGILIVAWLLALS